MHPQTELGTDQLTEIWEQAKAYVSAWADDSSGVPPDEHSAIWAEANTASFRAQCSGYGETWCTYVRVVVAVEAAVAWLKSGRPLSTPPGGVTTLPPSKSPEGDTAGFVPGIAGAACTFFDPCNRLGCPECQD